MITMKDIVKDGTPVLREVAEEIILPASEKEKEILQEMLQYLINSQDPELAQKYQLRSGIGLAAPQIGINKRMFAVHLTDENGKVYSYGLFNPKIVSHSVEKTYLEGGEGCLSVDEDIPGIVPRYARITVTAVDLEGNPVKLRLKGLPAICFQHELDHLNGVMFYDHIDKKDPFKVPENATKL
jgi:peptide deformylase